MYDGERFTTMIIISSHASYMKTSLDSQAILEAKTHNNITQYQRYAYDVCNY